MVAIIPLGLTVAQHRAYEKTLGEDHEIRVRANVLTNDYVFRRGLTPLVMPGSQVNVDGHGESTSRTASLSLCDPDRTIPDTVRKHYMRIHYDVLVTRLNLGWVEVPLITGPITSFVRNDAFVDMEISGADWDASTRHTWVPLELPKGMRKTTAIRKILSERAGIARFSLPDLDAPMFRLPEKKTLGRLSHPWIVAKKIAQSMDRQLYMDGRGVVRMRKLPHNNPQFVFRDGNGGLVATEPVLTFTDDAESFANGVWATGRVLKGAKKPLEARVWAPREHELSPHTLATNGVPYRLVDAVDNPSFRDVKALKAWAQRRLHEDLKGSSDIAVDTFVVPHLDAGDLVAIRTESFHDKHNIFQFSIPLEPSGLMSLGYHRKTSFGPTAGGKSWTNTPPQNIQIDHGSVGVEVKHHHKHKHKHHHKHHHKHKRHHHHKHGKRHNRPGPRHA